MRLLGFIDAMALQSARAAPVTAEEHGARITLDAGHAAEMARHRMLERYGLSAYTAGYSVYTTLDSRLQAVAREAVIEGLVTYDRRHGYRGPERRLLEPPAAGSDTELPIDEWLAVLADTPVLMDMHPAIVTAVDEDGADLLLTGGETARLPFANGISSARRYISEDRRAAAPERTADVLAVGDLVRVVPAAPDAAADTDSTSGEDTVRAAWQLTQVPAAQAALVALDPSNGAITSLVGGSDFSLSKFNRATQAQRQPGSNMKPFLYSAALDAGFSAASIINDAPIVMEDSSLEGIWRPENDSGRFLGPTRLRNALASSRNLVSIRLLQQLGVRRFIDYAQALGIDTSNFTADLSLALGTQTMAPMDVAAAYAILANGGYHVEPYLIERIEDLAGNIVFEARPATVCRRCDALAVAGETPALETAGEELSMEEILEEGEPLPEAPRVMDERVHFIIDNMLMDVIRRGTGRRALVLDRDDIAGKTGTTNGPVDAWFSGYNPDVVATTWVGFDDYARLGRREFGGTAALPIWINYMRGALAERPERSRELPEGISHVRIDPDTGLLAPAGTGGAIFEYFRNDNMPPAQEEEGSLLGTDDLIRDIF